MNRYLTIPLGLFLVGFAVTYFSQPKAGGPSLNSSAVFANMGSSPAITKASFTMSPTVRPTKPLALADAKVMILDQWPTKNDLDFASRAFVPRPLSASLGELAEKSEVPGGGAKGKEAVSGQTQSTDDRSSFLFSLSIATWYGGPNGSPGEDSFAVHVDRATQSAHIFADSRWQEYSHWRDQALPVYQDLIRKKGSEQLEGMGGK